MATLLVAGSFQSSYGQRFPAPVEVDPNTVTPGEFVIEPPTLENLGFEWFIDGDANRNASVAVSYRGQGTNEVDPETGQVLRTIESDRFVTGVTWVDDELWHGTWEENQSDIRRIDPSTGEVLERLEMPPGTGVSGLESDGGDCFFCGGGRSAKVRTVRKPRRAEAAT